MKININSVHFPPSEVLNQKIESKLNRAFQRYPYIKEAQVFLRLQPNEPTKQQLMEVRIALPQGELFAETRAETFYHALDLNLAKLKRQLEKYKQKTYAHP